MVSEPVGLLIQTQSSLNIACLLSLFAGDTLKMMHPSADGDRNGAILSRVQVLLSFRYECLTIRGLMYILKTCVATTKLSKPYFVIKMIWHYGYKRNVRVSRPS